MTRIISDAVQQAVWDQYAPKLGDEVDPRCLYVGPLSVGMARYMPEIAALVAPRGDSNPLGIRHKLKRLFMDLVNPRTGRRESPSGDDVAGYGFGRIEFSREDKPWILLSKDRLLSAEPGEILNSVEAVEDPETGQLKLYEPTLQGEARQEVLPIIRRDLRFGLHYLLVGDRFRITYTARERTRVLEYRLRPVSEGSSLVGPVATAPAQEVA